MRVVQTIASTRFDHGGTSRSVPSLCDALSEQKTNVYLVTGIPADASIPCNCPSSAVSVRRVQESKLHRQFGMTRRFGDVLTAILSETNTVQQIVHDHGMWLSTNRAAARVTREMKVPRVVSPRGMLTDWSLRHGYLKKKIAWSLFQHRDLRSADAFHATGQQEADDIRRLGFEQPIVVLPNGVSLPSTMPDRRTTGNPHRVLFMSRIHPKKGLINLLRAWRDVAPGSQWTLVLAGPDEKGHRSEVESFAKQLGVLSQLEFPGPVAENDKWSLYRSADLFVLPSFSENFGIVVAEALAAGLPVITTTPTPWQELPINKMGWWVDPTPEGISQALREALAQTDGERLAMGRRAEQWASSRFSWLSVGKRMLEFYRWILKAGDRPSFVV